MIINKNIKGITLIALIITIIVLLILAGVTLSSLFGQDSIIGKAKEAADKWNNAIDDENEYFSHFGEESSGQEEEEEPIVETNPDFFTYSNPDRNDEVFITGFTTGVGSGEEAYTNNDETVLKLVIPKQNKEGKNIIGIADNAFNNRTKIIKLVLQDNIEEVGRSSFVGCTNLANLTLPINMTGYSYKPFEGCINIARVRFIAGKNGHTEGINYNTSSSYINYYQYTPWYISQTQNLDIEFEKGITKIGKNTFRECDNLRNVNFPDSITQVEECAFLDCSKAQIFGEKIKNLTLIGQQAFKNCAGLLGKIEINNSITEISRSAFEGCTGITELYIPPNVEKLGNTTFSGCTNLATLTIPISTEGYSSKPFEGCTNVSKVRFTTGKNGNAEGINYNTSSSYINYYQYTPWYISQTQNLDIEFEKGITKIGKNTFRECDNLRNVNFPDSIIQVEECAFLYCSKAQISGEKIKNLTLIGEQAFKNCAGLSGKIEINNSITEISRSAFEGCIDITELYIPPNVEKLGNTAFSGCTNLATLTIPISTEGYSSKPFEGCTNVSKVRFTTGKNGNAEGINYNTSSSYINYYQYTPWYISREKNPKIIIENGITKIGNNTFLGSENSQYYYTGSSSEWAQVTGTGGINISSSNFNYSE